MGKRRSQPNCTGQLSGAKVIIKEVHNDALSESVTIANKGAVAQPLCGWVLATLRGEKFYAFPDDLVLRPKMAATIHSGQDALNNPSSGLLWTEEQVWNNQGDVAVLFDANGLEVDRYAYPHGRIMGSADKRPMRLLRDGETRRMVGEP